MRAATWKLCLGWALVGLGGPSLALGVLLIRMVFLPGRGGQAMAAFRPDHPAFVASVICLAAGLALVVPGTWLLRTAPTRIGDRSADPPPG